MPGSAPHLAVELAAAPPGSEASRRGLSGPFVATLVSRSSVAPGIVDLIFAMRTPSRLVFRGGQFVSIAVGADQTGVIVRRSYSVASPSSAGDRLRFIIRVISEGLASDFLMALPIGIDVPMTGPHGFFVLDDGHPGDIVFGATGTGVAAVMSMLVELAQRAPVGRRVLHWGVRHREDLFAVSEIQTLCRQAHCDLAITLTAPPPDWTGARGRITAIILDELPRLVSPTFYLVGNGAMIAELKAALIARGVNRKRQIRTEAFFD